MKKQETKRKTYSKRFPMLLPVLLVILATAVLLGGRSLKFFPPEFADSNPKQQVASTTIQDGVQYVSSTMSSRKYEPITVQKGMPVKWTLTAPSGSLTSCNSTIVIPEYNLEIPLKEGENLIEFTPKESGAIGFSCWMGMIQSRISVVE